MLVLMLRTGVIYLGVLSAMRLMGKRQLAELQPAELVSTILISNLASISIESAQTPLLNSLMPLFLITAIEICNAVLVLKWPAYARLVLGNPKRIIENGQLDVTTLTQLRLRVEDVLEALRGQNIYDLREVCYAIVETNGTIHAAKYPAKEPVTREDLALTGQKDTPVLPFWLDGQTLHQNLAFCGRDASWLKQQMQANHTDPDQLLAVLGDADGCCVWVKKRAYPKGHAPEDSI